MKKIIKNMIVSVFTLALLGVNVGAIAERGQFYLAAKNAPLGASSSLGKGQKAVYVRWDLVEGEIPDDVIALRLERDGTVLLEKAANDVMSVSEINQLYSGVAEQQRLLQTITMLKDYALSQKPNYGQDNTDGNLLPGSDFNAAAFAIELQRLFATESAWSYLASRQNFNIARARFRAFLDTEAPENSTYRLLAVNALGEMVQIGQVDLDSSQNVFPLGPQLKPVSNFHQVAKSSCSIADSMQDHYTVALDWKPGGANITENAASSIQLAGYLLYRSKADFTGQNIPQVDLASLASQSSHDQQGNLQFTDLERAEPFMIISESNGDSYLDAAFFQSEKALKAAGLKPGDRRAYYIAPVDFAGHIGKTSSAIVIVPDRTLPPTPWNIGFSQRQGATPSAKLVWDASTLFNYKAKYGASRTFCNEGTSEANQGLVAYDSASGSCEEPTYIRLGLTDRDYLVYRFNTAQQARNFVDQDSDGFNDSEEAVADRCNSALPVQGSGLTNYLVARNDIENQNNNNFETVNLDNGGRKETFKDDFLVENVTNAYWYRIAAKTSNGNLSPMSAANKVSFRDMVLPEPPTYTTIVRGNCCEITEKEDSDDTWSFDDQVQTGAEFSLSYTTGESKQTPYVNINRLSVPAGVVSHLCPLKDGDSSPIDEFWGKSNRPRTFEYRGVCEASISQGMDLCQAGDWQLTTRSCDMPLEDGQIVEGNVEYTITFPEGTCGSASRRIGNSYTRVATSCGTANAGVLVVTGEPGECFQTASEDPSGNVSPPVELPCSRSVSTTTPNPPQPISLALADTEASFSWRLPLEPVAVVLAEISSDASEQQASDSDSQLISIATAGFEPARLMDSTTAIHALLAHREQWCVRFKSIAPQSPTNLQEVSSEWSQRICSVRRATGDVSTEYLPWPKIDALNVNIGWPLVFSGADLVNETFGLQHEKMPLLLPMLGPNSQSVIEDVVDDCVFASQIDDENIFVFAKQVTCFSPDAVEKVEEDMHKYLGSTFMVYRKARTSDGAESQWVQVSPLIEGVFWVLAPGKVGTVNPLDTWDLFDPYFKMVRRGPSEPREFFLAFVDRYPYTAGYSYQYQFVVFNNQHAIEKIHQTDWYQTDASLQDQQGEN